MGGRNKHKERLTKAQKKALKNGQLHLEQEGATTFSESGAFDSHHWRGGLDSEEVHVRRTGLDTRRPAKSGSTESIVHATLFCVLVAIIVSWALGY